MTIDKLRFAILGAGAIGSIIGAHLARSGHSVVMLARGARAQELAQHGLRIRGLAEFSQAVPVVVDPSQFKGADVLIVAVKTYGTEAALNSLRHAPVDTALSIQNGLMKNDQLAAAWGKQHVLGALADTSGELLPTGEVLFTRNERLYIGELNGGDKGRAQQIARTIEDSGVRAAYASDIESLEWSKFAAWMAMMVLSVITRAETWKYLIDPDLALVSARLIREAGTLAMARHIILSDHSPLPVATILKGSEEQAVEVIQAVGRKLRSDAPRHRMSTLQDLEAGRPLEVDETVGYALRMATDLNLSLPLLRSSHSLVAGIDRIRR